MGLVVYTTAPKDYDYGYVTEVASDFAATTGSNRKLIRKVVIEGSPFQEGYQLGRYTSGLHMVADPVEFDKLVDYKLVEILEK